MYSIFMRFAVEQKCIQSSCDDASCRINYVYLQPAVFWKRSCHFLLIRLQDMIRPRIHHITIYVYYQITVTPKFETNTLPPCTVKPVLSDHILESNHWSFGAGDPSFLTYFVPVQLDSQTQSCTMATRFNIQSAFQMHSDFLQNMPQPIFSILGLRII